MMLGMKKPEKNRNNCCMAMKGEGVLFSRKGEVHTLHVCTKKPKHKGAHACEGAFSGAPVPSCNVQWRAE